MQGDDLHLIMRLKFSALVCAFVLSSSAASTEKACFHASGIMHTGKCLR
jgi:hypothetical protein